MDGLGSTDRVKIPTESAGWWIRPSQVKLRIVADSHAAWASEVVARRRGSPTNRVMRLPRQHRNGNRTARGRRASTSASTASSVTDRSTRRASTPSPGPMCRSTLGGGAPTPRGPARRSDTSRQRPRPPPHRRPSCTSVKENARGGGALEDICEVHRAISSVVGL